MLNEKNVHYDLKQRKNSLLDKHEPLTLDFMQVGLDIVTSTICKSQLKFGQTNFYQLLYIASSTYFNQQLLSADGILIPNLHKALAGVSYFRLSKQNLASQFYKVALHELGHTAGLPHCATGSCFMRDAKGGNPINSERDFCIHCKSVLKKKGWQLD